MISTRQFNKLRSSIGTRHIEGVQNGLAGQISEQPRLIEAPAAPRFDARAIASAPRIPGQTNTQERQLLAALRFAGVEMRFLLGAKISTGAEYRAEQQRRKVG